MKLLILMTFIPLTFAYGQEGGSFPGKLTGEITLENRIFFTEGAYGNDGKEDISLILKPEYSYSWDQDRNVVTFIPYLRQNSLDTQKNLFDLRELSYVASFANLEFRAGISKVYWGVTESVHLVDVINQTDFAASFDGEQKLGQPMVNPTLVTKYGNFSYFLLPVFRERTFPGDKGRIRGSLSADPDGSLYEDSEKENHIDHAFRWSHYYSSFEWAVSYFQGTDREPQFTPNSTFSRLNANYVQTKQVGVELQYNLDDWIFKAEYLHKDSSNVDYYQAAVAGLEYTFSNIWGGKDVGVLYEYIYDDRLERSFLGLYNSSFLGTRLAFNDASSTDLLVGGIFDNDAGSLTSFRIEGSHRLAERWKLSVEVNIIDNPPAQSILTQLKQDDYAQLNLSFYY